MSTELDWNKYKDNTPEPKTPSWRDAFLKPRRLRGFERVEQTLRTLSPGERLLLYILTATFGLSALVMVSGVNALATVTVPTPGGTLVEGEIGSARFINPLLTLSSPDEDLTALIYSGLMRALPDGSLVPDLAESYSISEDGRVYTFKLRPEVSFHDGVPVTSADVAFTVQQAVGPSINSSRRADWTGVGVTTPDVHTVVFTLQHAYAPFLQNATLGILPRHLWESVRSEEFPFSPLNTDPVGSGPYRIADVKMDSTGAAERYDLVPFKKYALGAPNIKHISFVFFPNTQKLIEALEAKEIDAVASLSPEDLNTLKRSDTSIVQVALPRVFGVFFNQSHNNVLAEKAPRAALEAAVDKRGIINAALAGRGTLLTGPIPPGLLGETAPATPKPLADITSTASTKQETLIQNTKAILQKDGWTFDQGSASWKKDKKTLAFTLATVDQAELISTAKALVADWKATGISVTLQIYPISELNTAIIRPRNYDAILFGEVVGPELDLYAFWHSSQRNDPGLNLALYANPRTDSLLSEARATTNEGVRANLYSRFATIIESDHPAIFLYAPDFLYIVPEHLRGIELGALKNGADRFGNVHQWYMDTERVWKIFAPEDQLRATL